MTWESLIFDIDGTLWDSRALVAEGYNIQLHREGLDHLFVTADILKSLFGKVTDDIADVLFGEIPTRERYALMDRCMETERQYIRQVDCGHIGYPRVRETLEELSKKHRLFIVSNCEQGYPELCMEKLGLTDLIQGHLCFGDTLTCKGETIRRLMEMHHIQNCAYVGDTQGDRDACTQANIPFIYAAYGFGQVDRYEAKIDSIDELLRL